MVAVFALLIATVLIGFGVLHLRYPYRIARFEEQIDAIGSKRDFGGVEPAEWKVSLTKFGGGVLVGLGLVFLYFGLVD